MSSSQSQGDSAGSSNEQPKKPTPSRRGVNSSKPYHGRSPQTQVAGKEDNTAQKRIKNMQQRSHERGGEYKLRPQTGRSEHNKGTDSKPPQRSSSGQTKIKTTHSRKTDSDVKKSPKTSDQSTKTTTSKDIKRTDRKDSGIGYSPPTAEATTNELEGGDNSVIDDKVDSNENKGQADTEGESAEPVETSHEETKPDNRIQYNRDHLLELSELPFCQERHPALNEVTCDLLFLRPTPLSKQTTESEVDSKKKHPTALSLIKDQLPQISLSPQRKSFQGGCGWKDSKHQDSPKSNQDGNFDFETPYPPPRANQPKHKVIDHIPLRDQELGRDKKNWRDKNKEPQWAKNNHYSNNWDDEPEWMEYGPIDRFELIELKGLDEHERDREARLGRDEEDGKSLSDEEAPSNCDVTKPSGKQPRPDGSTYTNETETAPRPTKEEMMLKTALELDNEFMLDGFDFSTGLSFCQALDDEEDGRSLQNPADFGNALMKVLRVGAKSDKSSNKKTNESILGMSSRPVNALTLDEIHARENIPTTPTETIPTESPSSDLGAFNKLVAGLQSTGALNKEQNQLKQIQVKPPPTSTSLSPIPMPKVAIPTPIRQTEPKHPPQQNTFGNMLEKEIDFNEEAVTGAHPHYQTPAPPQFPNRNANTFSRVEHLERMLEKLDHNHQSMFRKKSTPAEIPPQAFPDPPHMKPKIIPGHGVRMSTMERSMPQPMIEREYTYTEMGGDYRMEMMPPPNIGIRPQGGVTRSSPNNWAVEMERRRLFELKQMERARMMDGERMYNGGMSAGMQHKMPPSKPNISLLPTAVMRQLHNSKPNQSLSEVTKTSSGGMSSRMDQDMGHSRPHSGMMSDGDHLPPRMHPGMYPMGGGGRPPLRQTSDPAAMMYQRGGYYNMPPVIPQHGGMQNPYMY